MNHERVAEYTVALGLCPDVLQEQLSSFLGGRDFVGAFATVGRNANPVCLALWRRLGIVSDADLARAVPDAWSAAEWPCRAVPRRIWLEWFAVAGFVSDPPGRPAPTEPLEVWRAQVGRVLGLAWTTSEERGRWFHDRNANYFKFSGARLLRGTVQPAGVLALCDGREESEVIVHPKRVRWQEAK